MINWFKFSFFKIWALLSFVLHFEVSVHQNNSDTRVICLIQILLYKSVIQTQQGPTNNNIYLIIFRFKRVMRQI